MSPVPIKKSMREFTDDVCSLSYCDSPSLGLEGELCGEAGHAGQVSTVQPFAAPTPDLKCSALMLIKSQMQSSNHVWL